LPFKSIAETSLIRLQVAALTNNIPDGA